MSGQPVFSEDDVSRMVAHMNDDHADSVLLYAQVYGGQPGATHARLESVDPEGMDITVDPGEGETDVRVPFDHTLRDSHDAHMTMVKMSKAARRQAGGGAGG